MKKRFGLVGATVVILGVAGCSALGRQAFANPTVTLKDVKIVSVGLTGGSLDVVLNVYNPNGYRLDATRLSYRLQVDSTPLANGVMDSRFTVLEKDSSRVSIPVTFSWSGLGAGVRQIVNTGAVNYRVIGDVTIRSPVGNFTIPFTQTGRYRTLGR